MADDEGAETKRKNSNQSQLLEISTSKTLNSEVTKPPPVYFLEITSKIKGKISQLQSVEDTTKPENLDTESEILAREAFGLIDKIVDEYIMYLWNEETETLVENLINATLEKLSRLNSRDIDTINTGVFIIKELDGDPRGFRFQIGDVVKKGYAKAAYYQYQKNCEEISSNSVFTHEVSNTTIAKQIITSGKVLMSRQALEKRGITLTSDRTAGVGEANALFVDKDKFHYYGPVGWAFSLPRVCEQGYLFGLRDFPFGYASETDYKESFFTNSTQAVERGIISDGTYTNPINQTTDDDTSIPVESGVFLLQYTQKTTGYKFLKMRGMTKNG